MMTIICPENERIKHRYFEYVKEALQRSEGTLEEARKCIHRFEQFTKCANFKTFNKKVAMDFKKTLRNTKSKQTGETLSLSTLEYTIRNVKDFLIWLAQQPGYRSKVKLADIEYLNLSENDIRAAKSCTRRKYPSLEQVIATLESMPAITEVEQRNRAMLAFLLLTGVRVDVLVSLRMKHINLDSSEVVQNPKEVPTKRRKTIYTFFFPVGDHPRDIFCQYYRFLKQDKLFGPNDPLFPMTDMQSLGVGNMTTISRKRWKTSQNASKLIKAAFNAAIGQAFPPHTIRHTLVEYGEKICVMPSQMKAWSLNLGHTHTSTTLNSYASMNVETQEKQMHEFWKPKSNGHEDTMLEVVKLLQDLKKTSSNDVP